MTGKPLFFDPDIYLSAVEQMIMSDEVEQAFRMLDNVPAFYRDHPTPRMAEIRDSLHRQLFTPAQYSTADVEGDNLDIKALEQLYPHRAQLVAEQIRDINSVGVKPNIMEIGPGTFWLPYCLRARGLEFTYEYQSLHRRPLLPFDQPKDDSQVNIFVAFELIEHLHNENEIYQAYLKFKKQASYIFVSTPLYTYGGGMPDWRANALGHLRTYTPQELARVIRGFFPAFRFEAHLSDTITLAGVHNVQF